MIEAHNVGGRAKKRCTLAVPGIVTVTRCKRRINDPASSYHKQFVEYYVNGEQYGGWMFLYAQKGETMTVHVNPDNPAEFFVYRKDIHGRKKRPWLIVISVGVLLWVVFLLVYTAIMIVSII